ncbi:MAG: hypothetical protein JJV88_04470 [Sulfurovum sp.]|nr:hypothetical protein [Sulfurovaceae bacterium]
MKPLKSFKFLLLSTLILPQLLLSNIEISNNSCETPYPISQLSGISDDVNYQDNYTNKHSKEIYLSFNTAVDGNFSIELLKDNDKKMKYQLFIGNSCDNLNLVSKPSFEYTYNVNIQVAKSRDYIIKVVKHSNGNSRYNISYSFIADKEEVIHGHTLPPEPDPVINNSTLLGIDSNNNGVRDDVERWIYHTHKDKHPIYMDILMQSARGYKLSLETPERAREIHKEVGSAMSCESYYNYCIDDANINEKRIIAEDEYIITKYFVKIIYFNTKERTKTYRRYNQLLSGGVYGGSSCSEEKQYCDFNTTKYEE